MALNMKNESPGRVKFDGCATVQSNNGDKKRVGSLQEALSEEAKCGCGIECGCYSYLTLKNYNTTTMEASQIALCVINGAIMIGTVDEVKAAIDLAKEGVAP